MDLSYHRGAAVGALDPCHDRKVASSNPISAIASTLIRPKSNIVSSKMDHRAVMIPNRHKMFVYETDHLVSAWHW